MTASCPEIPEKLNCPLYENFNYEGWVLPCSSTVYFNKEWKKLLWQFFMDGKQNGKNVTPKQTST